MSERRRAQRVRANLDTRWEGLLARREGNIVDVSSTGCFLLTTDAVTQGELIRLEIQLPSGKWVYLWAEVMYSIPEMGFALRFTGSIDEREQSMLELLIGYVSGKQIGAEVYIENV